MISVHLYGKSDVLPRLSFDVENRASKIGTSFFVLFQKAIWLETGKMKNSRRQVFLVISALCLSVCCCYTEVVSKRKPEHKQREHIETSRFRGLEISIIRPVSAPLNPGQSIQLRIDVTNVSSAAFPVVLLECVSPDEPWNAVKWTTPVGKWLTYNAKKDVYEPRRSTEDQPGRFATILLGSNRKKVFNLTPVLTDDIGLLQYNLRCLRANVRTLANKIYVERSDGTYAHPDANQLLSPTMLPKRVIIKNMAGVVAYPIRPTIRMKRADKMPGRKQLGFAPARMLYSSALEAWLAEAPDGKMAQVMTFGVKRFEALTYEIARFIETAPPGKIMVKREPNGRMERVAKGRLLGMLAENDVRAMLRGASSGWLLCIEKSGAKP